MYIPRETPPHTRTQRGHSPQRHTAAGTAPLQRTTGTALRVALPEPPGRNNAHDDDMLTPIGYPPPNTAADTAHSAHSTHPALRPHRATPRVEDNPPQTRRPHAQPGYKSGVTAKRATSTRKQRQQVSTQLSPSPHAAPPAVSRPTEPCALACAAAVGCLYAFPPSAALSRAKAIERKAAAVLTILQPSCAIERIGTAGPPPVHTRSGGPPVHIEATRPPPVHTRSGPPPVHSETTSPPPVHTRPGPPPVHSETEGWGGPESSASGDATGAAPRHAGEIPAGAIPKAAIPAGAAPVGTIPAGARPHPPPQLSVRCAGFCYEFEFGAATKLGSPLGMHVLVYLSIDWIST